jgi:DNA-binding transcriptional MocR family regulator
VLDVSAGGPDPALLPPLGAVLRRLDTTPVLYGHESVDVALQPWARRWASPPGITPEGVAVVGGALDGVERVLLAHTRTGDRVAVEDPGYAPVFDLLAALGLSPVPVAIDERGMRPDALTTVLASGRITALVSTPRAHNPTGAALDATRAAELRRVLDGHPDIVVIEDDHAGPVAGSERQTVISEQRRRWASVASVAKSLGPDLRVAFLAGDGTTVDRVAGRQQLGTGWVSHLLQRCVATILDDDGTAALLEHAAGRYAARRARLVERLDRAGVLAHGRSGLNVWVPVDAEPPVCAAMAQRGWWVRAGHPYRLASQPAVRISVGALDDDQLDALATDLLAALHAGVHRRVG